MSNSLIESVALRPVAENVYESVHNPGKMGNAANIAYGGCTIATAMNAAHKDVPPGFFMYSTLGTFLAPALADRKLLCTVRLVRSTRVFATKQVEVSQTLDDGKRRSCLLVLVDFQAAEPATLLQFSKPPARHYSGPDETPEAAGVYAGLVASGVISQKLADATLSLLHHYWDARAPKEAVSGQNYIFLAKKYKTDQDQLPPTDKTSASWLKPRRELTTPAEHAVALSWMQDGGLSFLPLVHSHLWLDDASACGTLEFALRVFSNNLNLNEWHLRESRCVVAGEGRSYSEALVWDGAGNLVSSMTQQSILRPLPTKVAKM